MAPLDGICWGEQNPDPAEEPVTWQRWLTDGAGGITVVGDVDWGKAEIAIGDGIVSPVTDTGDSATKTFTVTRDKYGIGSGTVTLSIRGSATTFSAFDALPTWDLYTVPVDEAWQYFQLRIEGGP